MKAKSIKANSINEIAKALQDNVTSNFKPTLAFVFLSMRYDLESVMELFNRNDILIFGATSNGEFVDEQATNGGIAVLLLELNMDYFFIDFKELNGSDDRIIAMEVARKAVRKYKKPGFLIAGSNLLTDAEQLVRGFEDVIGSEIELFGGMAGDDFTFSKQYVFTNSSCSERGLVVVIIDTEKVLIKGRATCGWKAVGTEKTVTKSDGAHVYTIENIPALDITAKYSGITGLNKENLDFFTKMTTSFPLQLQRENGDPVMRPGLVVDWDDHSFICSGAVPQGAKVKFSLPPDFDVVEKVISECKKLKETELPEADALVMFNCAGRIMSLGPMINEEIEGVREVWNNVPLAGFFSYAELAKATGGRLEMLNLSSCCVGLKEK